MMKLRFDKDQWQMVVALVVVASVAAVILGLTDMWTKAPIAKAQKEALHGALLQVLPSHVNDPQLEKFSIRGEDKRATVVFPARDASGHVVGFAWEVVAPDGYSGSIRILIGVRPDGAVHAIRVIDHQETPGLGDGITKNHAWLASFVGQSLQSRIWKVKKDGGDFDQFTGATITPRAVVKAVKGALEFFTAHQGEMMLMLKGEKR